jgi:hypothetical protein
MQEIKKILIWLLPQADSVVRMISFGLLGLMLHLVPLHEESELIQLLVSSEYLCAEATEPIIDIFSLLVHFPHLTLQKIQ